MNKRALLVVVAALSGCSGDDSIAIDDLPAAIQSAECDFEVRCELMPDQATCAAAFPLDSTDELTAIAEVHNGRISYDGKLAKQCVDVFLGLHCNLSELENTVVDACNNIFAGTIAVGAACIVTEDCVDHGNCVQTDPNCDSSTACCAGSCVAVPAKVAIGGACTSSNPDCVEGAYCDVPSGAQAGTCKAFIAGEGSVCDAFNACAAPRSCVIPPNMTTGTCTTLPAEGEACDNQQFLACGDLRDYCDQTTLVCTHHASIGEACDGANGASCVGFASCDTTTSKCVARPGLGDACDASTGLDCLGGLSCVNLTCVGQPAGMTCAL